MAVQLHGCELVRGRIGHHTQSPEGLRDRAAGGSYRLSLQYMEWSQYDGSISPDGSVGPAGSCAIRFPLRVVVIDGFVRREVVRQVLPGNAGSVDVRIALTISRKSWTGCCTGAGPVARQAVKTGSIKAQRASETSLRYGRRAFTPRSTTAIPDSHKNIPNYQLPRSDALLTSRFHEECCPARDREAESASEVQRQELLRVLDVVGEVALPE